MNAKIVRLLILLPLLFIGCETGEVRKADRKPNIDYIIVEIEGKKWIATNVHGGYSLAGPLDN